MVQALEAGTEMPPFRLPGAGGGVIDSRSFRGRALVLFFYPKANTPGCSREAADFERLRPRFRAAGAEVVGISADPVKALDRFRAKQALTLPLVSDPEHHVLTAYGVWAEKQLYGRKFMGIVRSTFLIDPAGTVAQVWRNVRVPGHAETVLAAAEALHRRTPV